MNHYLQRLLIAACFVLFAVPLFAQTDEKLDTPPIRQIPIGTMPTPSTDNFVITPDGFDNFNMGTAFAEPHGVSSPLNNLAHFSSFNTNSAFRTSNGFTWTASAPPFPGFVVRGDPVNAYDSLGRLFYMTMVGSPGITNCVVIRSTDNGTTWSAPVVAIAGVDKNWIAADQTNGPYSNTLYCVMTNSPSTNSQVTRSTDGGQTFNVVYTANNQLPGMMVCVGANGAVQGGAVYVVTNTGSSFTPTWTFHRSTDGGTTWTVQSIQNGLVNTVGTQVGGRNAVLNMRTRPYPMIAADNSYGPNRGKLYLVYAGNDPPGNGNKPDIFCQSSIDGGVTFSTPVKINDDANPLSNHQFFPAIWCDKWTGRLWAKWLDSRNTPTSDSMEVYASFSDDGGLTWAANQKVSNRKMPINCPTCGGGGTPAYQGDYDAIHSSRNGLSMLTWTDFRAGNFASYSAYFPDFAVQTPLQAVSRENDTIIIPIRVPATTGYNGRRAKFTAALAAPNPNITLSFLNGRDSLQTYPDSVMLRVQVLGAITGNYTINVDADGGNGQPPFHKRVITLRVSGPLPILTTSTSSLNFGLVRIGQDSSLSFRVRNTGVGVLNVSSIVSSSIRFVPQQSSLIVPVGDSGTITVRFTPTTSFQTNATLTLRHNALDTLTQLTLIGRGRIGVLSTATELTFEQVPVGTDSTRRLRILNQGNDTLQISSISSSSPRFTATPATLRISPGDSGFVNVRFTPIAAGVVNATLTLTHDGSGGSNQVSLVGATGRLSVTRFSNETPKEFALLQNYPNPFNPSTAIRYTLSEASQVRLSVYDMLGREVATLVNERQPVGAYQAVFNASQLASGTYFYKLQAGGFVQTKKMLLVK
jgi:hypothetical protein